MKNRLIHGSILAGAGVLLLGLGLVGCDGDRPVAESEPARESEVETVAERGSDGEPREPVAFSAAVEDRMLAYSGRLDVVDTFSANARVNAAPVLYGQRLIFGTTAGTVRAFDLESDSELWYHDAQGAVMSMTVAEGRVVYATDDAIVALSPEDGEILWQTRIWDTPTTRITGTARSVYVGLLEGPVLCLALDDGAIRWRASVPESLVDRIVVAECIAYGVTAAGTLLSFDAAGGNAEWNVDVADDSEVVAAPAVHRGRLAVASSAGTTAVYNTSGARQALMSAGSDALYLFPPVLTDDSMVLARASGTLVAYQLDGGSVGEQLWEVELPSDVFGAPFTVGDMVIVPVSSGLTALSVSDGTVVDRLLLSGFPTSAISALDDRVLFALSDGTVVLVNVDADEADVPLLTDEGVWNLPPGGAFRLSDRQVSLRMRTPREAIFDITATAEPPEDLILQVLDPDGNEVASNMGKVELSPTVRAALRADVPYTLFIRRPDGGGEVRISLTTELID